MPQPKLHRYVLASVILLQCLTKLKAKHKSRKRQWKSQPYPKMHSYQALYTFNSPALLQGRFSLYPGSYLYVISSWRFTSKTQSLFFILFLKACMSALKQSSPRKPSQSQEHPLSNASDPLPLSEKLMDVKDGPQKEIINIESSSEKHLQKKIIDLKQTERHGLTTMKSKTKKKLPKCQLCKGTGKKVEMKHCSSCKNLFHLSCLDENQANKKYICDKCLANQQLPESKVSKKQKKQQQKIQQQNTLQQYLNTNNQQPTSKLAQKKLDREKRKDQSIKSFQKFKEKYPYYINENNKVKFPVEDRLLFLYRDYFQLHETSNKSFVPVDHPIIPSKYLGDFLQLQNFIVSFSGELNQDYCGEYKKSVLYLTMNCCGPDRVFEQLLGAILKIYMKDIYEKNKTENVKILNDHSFFILLGNNNENDSNPSEYIAMIACQIIRHLSTIPSMKEAFKNFQFPEKLTLDTKLSVLIKLIQGLSEVDGFHDMVSRKSEKISQLTKDKAQYVSRLKHNEAEALSNKEKLKQIQGKMVEHDKQDKKEKENGQESNQNSSKKAKDSQENQKNKTKSYKLSLQHETSSKVIKQIRQRIVEITKSIPFTISQIMFLGTDRNQSHHYFYLREPNRIYVRHHSYMLDESDEFKIFEGKENIVNYMKQLINKGINEKHLIENLTFLIKQEILRNLSERQLQEQLAVENLGIQDYEGRFIETQDGFRMKIIDEVIEMQEKFSNYLAMKSCQWANQCKRQEFKLGFPFIDNIQSMKQAIKNLHDNFLFVEIVKQQQQRNGESDDNNEDMMHAQREPARRKKPMRIWGINSEKIKKFWMEYLEVCIDYTGLWIIIHIFKSSVEKYLEKKLDSIREMERRQNIEREKENKRRLREIREAQNLQIKHRSRGVRSKLAAEDQDQQISPQKMYSNNPPRRSLRTKNGTETYRRKPLTIDSDDEIQDRNSKRSEKSRRNMEDGSQYSEDEEDHSGNQQQCGVCREVGDVICCDTCPKVYHLECLKLKEVPEGDWSCIECLQKIANTRQTRSRGRITQNKQL